MDEGDVRPVLGKVVAALQADENLGEYETLFKTQQPSSACCNNWRLRSKLERWTRDPRRRRRSDGQTREIACRRPKVICSVIAMPQPAVCALGFLTLEHT